MNMHMDKLHKDEKEKENEEVKKKNEDYKDIELAVELIEEGWIEGKWESEWGNKVTEEVAAKIKDDGLGEAD